MLAISDKEKSKKEYWRDPSKVLSALAVVIPILFLGILSLAVFTRPVKVNTCNTHACMEQVNKLIRRMNIKVNPCDDFYEFVCGNILKDNSEKHLYIELNENLIRDLLKLYKEVIKDSEHKMVKTEKRLFKKCMNEEDIEKDDLTRIKEVIKEIGGWPVLDGESNINETKFDWVEATYKLRELGYPFSFFFKVDVTRDMKNKEKLYLQITMQQGQDEIMNKYSKCEAAEIMAKVAKVFGAKNEDLTVEEMTKVYELWEKLDVPYTSYKKYTIKEFQKKYDQGKRAPFNWLLFLKKLVGPQIIVSSYDNVSLQGVETVSGWINIISTTSERTVGNYMIWKLIEANKPYLPKKIQDITKYSTNVPREEFCLEKTNKRFLQSPIEILNAKNILPAEERQQVQEIFSDIKSVFLNLLDRTVLMEDKDKQVIRRNVETLTLIYGLPEDYFGDKILDDMDVDLVETKGNTLLDLLAQVNRNRQTILFKAITLPASINVNSRSYIRQKYRFVLYNRAENELFVPIQLAYQLQLYTQRWSKYAFIGTFFGIFLTESLSKHDAEFGVLKQQLSDRTMYASKKIQECLGTQMHKYNLSQENWEIESSQPISTGKKVSYVAYEKWLQNNKEERLPGLNYTSRQLFWITSTYCHVPNPNMRYNLHNTVKFYSTVNLIFKLNNPYFARDFNCPEGSETNPVIKCRLYL